MNAKKALVRAILDTNDFLEYRRFTEIPWRELLQAERVVLVVPSTVVSELDQNKSENRSAKKRERARELLPLIEHFSQGVGEEIQEAVTMEYFVGNLEDVCKVNDLTASYADHKIVASAILARERNADSTIVLVTGDTGMRMTGKSRGVDTIAMPEQYRLPHAVDEEERERRQLERELQKLQARKPVMSIGWGEDLDQVLRPAVTPTQPQAEAEIETKLSQAIKLLRPTPSFRTSGTDPDDPRITEVQEVTSKYEHDYRQYLIKMANYQTKQSLTINATLRIENSGTKAATDVRLTVAFPQQLSIAEKRRVPPEEPQIPYQLRGHAALTGLHDLFGSRHLNDLSHLMPPVKKNVESWVTGYEVIMRIEKLQQSYSAPSRQFQITFGSVEDVGPCAVQYHLIADELLEPITGELSIVPTIGEVTSEDA